MSRKGSSKAITLGDGKVLAGSSQGWVPQFSPGEPSPGNTLSGRQNGTESPEAGIIISQSQTEPMRLTPECQGHVGFGWSQPCFV